MATPQVAATDDTPTPAGTCRPHCMHAAVKIVAIVTVGVVFAVVAAKNEIFQLSYDTVQVTGHATRPVMTDTAVMDLGVITITAPTQEEAITATSDKMTKIVAALDAMGIPQENRQVTGYAVNPRYKDPRYSDSEGVPTGDAPTVVGYTCSQQLTVRVTGIDKDPSLVDKVLLAATKEGANKIGEVMFYVKNVDTVQQELRLAAIADARAKASAAASAAHIELKAINGWYENIATPGAKIPPVAMPYGGGDPSGGGMPLTPTGTLPAPAGTPTLAAGLLDMTVDVNVSYRLRQ